MGELEPITREEMFMAAAAGESIPPLEPITRQEFFLHRIVKAMENITPGTGGNAAGSCYNVALAGILPDKDCSAELNELIKSERYLYFPEGVYTVNGVTITEDTLIQMHPNAKLHTDTGRMIQVNNCAFSISGGSITSGVDYPNRASTPREDECRRRLTTEIQGIIELYGCHDCSFESITVPYSSSGSVFLIYGDSTGVDDNGNEINRPITFDGKDIIPGRSKNIRFVNCSFKNFLLSAIHVLYGNDNIVMDNCTFIDALRAKQADYCYTAYTGVRSISNDANIRYIPTNGYVFRNCYVENCEGTGIDTHSASNVLYENNTFIDCDNFMTAYNDYGRVKTRDGWVMENIILRNNICKTTKAFNYANNSYPHPPIMLNNNGEIGMMRNIIVENNTIETNWYYKESEIWPMVSFYRTNNIRIQNNTFISNGELSVVARFYSCSGVVLDNLTIKGDYEDAFRFRASVCKVGSIRCADATITRALLRMHDAYYSYIDTTDFVTDNPLTTLVNNWRYALIRYGKPIQNIDNILPLTDEVCAVPGFYGKTTRDGVEYEVLADGKVKTGTMRFPVGTRVQFGTKEPASSFFVVDIKSNTGETGSRYYINTLDRVPTSEEIGTTKYFAASTPYNDTYTGTTPAETEE